MYLLYKAIFILLFDGNYADAMRGYTVGQVPCAQRWSYSNSLTLKYYQFLRIKICFFFNSAFVLTGVAWLTVRWTPDLRQVTIRESCFYKRLRNRSSHEAISAEAQRDV